MVEEIVREEFEIYVDLWKQHCQENRYCSDPNRYSDCQAYRSIVKMGEEVLPLIKEKYSSSDEEAFFPIFGWARAIREITNCVIAVPQEDRGDTRKIRNHYVQFLEQYLEN